jgi:transcriptional regulator GlxA family with amidase domain
MSVQILVFDGFDELDSLGPYEVLSHGSRIADIEVSLVTATGQRTVTGANGIRFSDLPLWTPDVPDVIIVPGGGARRAGPGVRAEIEQGSLPRLLRNLKQQRGTDVVLASVCSGTLLLGAAGLLVNRPATTHHSVLARLGEFGALPIDARVVDDGDIVSSAGVTSGLDLALHLIATRIGTHEASAVEAEIEYERRGAVWQRPDQTTSTKFTKSAL